MRSGYDSRDFGWGAEDYGMVAEAFDPAAAAAGFTLTGGASVLARVKLLTPARVSGLNYIVSTAGATLTANQNFLALYDAAGILLAQSADQTTNFGSTGFKTASIAVPVNVAAGNLYVIAWSVGTTPVSLAKAGTTGVNGALAATASRFGTANTGLTTTAPSPLGTVSALAQALWFGIS